MVCSVEWEYFRICRIYGVANETTRGVRIDSNQEEKGEMVGIPKHFEALLANFLVSGRVHKNHDQQHEVTTNASRLLVVNI